MVDKLNISGELTLRAYKDGVLQWEQKGKNLIVASGYRALLECLRGESDSQIYSVNVGTNSTAPVSSDSSITNPISLPVTNSYVDVYSDVKRLVVEFTFGVYDGNDKDWNEFGLVTKKGTLFSRKVVDTISKKIDMEIEGTWIINI